MCFQEIVVQNLPLTVFAVLSALNVQVWCWKNYGIYIYALFKIQLIYFSLIKNPFTPTTPNKSHTSKIISNETVYRYKQVELVKHFVTDMQS